MHSKSVGLSVRLTGLYVLEYGQRSIGTGSEIREGRFHGGARAGVVSTNRRCQASSYAKMSNLGEQWQTTTRGTL